MAYLIAYAKITENKFDGLVMEGIYFGGVAESFEHGENLARECASSIKGGTIIPKVFEMTSDCFIDALDTATSKFENIYDNMLQVDNTITPPRRAKWQQNKGLTLDTEVL